MHGPDAEITANKVKFPGLLIGEDVPLPVTQAEIANLVPAEGRVPVQELHQLAVSTYGAERVSEQGFMVAVQRCINAASFGYAPTETATIQTGAIQIDMSGYVGQPEPLPPDTRVIRLSGKIAYIDLAKIIKAAMNLAKLSEESSVTLDLRLELRGEINEHAADMAVNELRGGVAGLGVDDSKR